MVEVRTKLGNHVQIFKDLDFYTSRPALFMNVNGSLSSAMFLNSDELVYPYTKFYHLARFFNPDFESALMIGGGAYSFPKDFLKVYPRAYLDVVEIDPGLTELARKYFNLKNNPRLGIFHEDGRDFLDRNSKSYDVIFTDAFAGVAGIPYQLITKEAYTEMFNSLAEDGVLLMNVISTLEGSYSDFLRAINRTVKKVFPEVLAFAVQSMTDRSLLQNVMLICLKSKNERPFESDDSAIDKCLSHHWTEKLAEDQPVFYDV